MNTTDVITMCIYQGEVGVGEWLVTAESLTGRLPVRGI